MNSAFDFVNDVLLVGIIIIITTFVVLDIAGDLIVVVDLSEELKTVLFAQRSDMLLGVFGKSAIRLVKNDTA